MVRDRVGVHRERSLERCWVKAAALGWLCDLRPAPGLSELAVKVRGRAPGAAWLEASSAAHCVESVNRVGAARKTPVLLTEPSTLSSSPSSWLTMRSGTLRALR